MVLEVSQILDHVAGWGLQQPVAEPLTPAFSHLGSHDFVGIWVELFGPGLVQDEVEGPAVLVPAGLAFGDGSLALLGFLGLVSQISVGLAEDAWDPLRPGPGEDVLHELLCLAGQDGHHPALLDGSLPLGERGSGGKGGGRHGPGQGPVDGAAPELVGEHDG